MAKRTRLSREDRRAQLIELGLDMLATRQLEDLSVELIASTAGISRGLLFHYFDSKQDFHHAVAEAAAAEMLRRTEPDPDLAPVEALRAALEAFVGYVEENPDNYRSLVRGTGTGDERMRTVFDSTRDAMAHRIVGVVARLGVDVGPRIELAVQGWVGFAEECVIRWTDTRAPAVSRDALLDLLTRSLPAVALSAADDQAGRLLSVFDREDAIGAG